MSGPARSLSAGGGAAISDPAHPSGGWLRDRISYTSLMIGAMHAGRERFQPVAATPEMRKA
jgi:hypothetical protein